MLTKIEVTIIVNVRKQHMIIIFLHVSFIYVTYRTDIFMDS